MPTRVRYNHQNTLFDALINRAFDFPAHYFEENKFVNPFFHLEPIFGKISIIPVFLIKKQLMFKKLLSYFLPITIFKQKSTVSQTIEITWTGGKLVLDSENTNYSYGSLQRILRMGLKTIGYKNIAAMNDKVIYN